MTTNTGTETPAAGTANVPAVEGQPATGVPAANGEGAEALPTEGAEVPASGTVEGEAAPAGDPPAEDPPADADAGDVLVGAPEKYEDFTAPEGFGLDPELVGPFQEAAKAANLSQAGAQRMVDFGMKVVEKTLEGFQAQHIDRVEQWVVQAKADPEVGGRAFEENVRIAQSVIAQYGDAEVKEAFDTTGIGNHPALLRLFARIGKAAGEAGFVAGQGSEVPAPPVSREQRLAQRMEQEQARGRK